MYASRIAKQLILPALALTGAARPRKVFAQPPEDIFKPHKAENSSVASSLATPNRLQPPAPMSASARKPPSAVPQGGPPPISSASAEATDLTDPSKFREAYLATVKNPHWAMEDCPDRPYPLPVTQLIMVAHKLAWKQMSDTVLQIDLNSTQAQIDSTVTASTTCDMAHETFLRATQQGLDAKALAQEAPKVIDPIYVVAQQFMRSLFEDQARGSK